MGLKKGSFVQNARPKQPPKKLLILGCRNGHIMCQNCVEKVEKCPTCRDKEIWCRNIFAERYIETELKDVSFKCKNLGCNVHLIMNNR